MGIYFSFLSMRKFTVFTLILTVVIVVIVSDLVVNKYLPALREGGSLGELVLSLPENLDLSKSIETNVLGDVGEREETFDVAPETESDADSDTNAALTEVEYVEYSLNEQAYREESSAISEVTLPSAEETGDFEDESAATVTYSPNVYIRDEQIKSAGFREAYLEEESHGGFLYKTVFFGDLVDMDVDKVAVRSSDELMAKIYVFKVGLSSDRDAVFEVLKVRAKESSGVDVNETNDFGNGSFYMNDSRRTNVAFLTVKIGELIYGFSYPKEFHSQVKNLVKLIEWEFGV